MDLQASSPPLSDAGPHQVDPRVVLSSIGEAVYDWDIGRDAISWSGNALSLFGLDDIARLSTGAGFEKLIDPISPSTRSESILLCDGADAGGGVPYRLSYAVAQAKGALAWFEDTGRWFAGADGRAAAAHGVVRRIPGPSEAERDEIAAATFDPLTGGYLRAPFLRLMAGDLAKAAAAGKASVFCLMAIHDLAFVNEACGVEAADEVIAVAARRIRSTMRRKDRFVRYSGGKLGVLLTIFEGGAVEEAARRFLDAVAGEPIRTAAGPVAVKLRIGCALATGAEPIALIRQAEEALAGTHAESGADIVVYRADAGRDAARRRNLSAADDVLRALNERRIVLALEPVLSATTRVPQFYEALVRVRAEDGAILGAGAVIPTAERFGLVKFVDIRVLELAAQALVRRPSLRLSVNVSMRTAVTPEWMAALSATVAANPRIADRLIVEITETAAMSDIEATAAIIGRVKALGLRVAIDDFGSGHTSFKSLRALPVDILKIDGAFVQNLARSSDDRFFVRTLVDLANHLGVQTVAEWVQDDETARLLAGWGVTFLQGGFCGEAAVEDEAADEPLRAAS